MEWGDTAKNWWKFIQEEWAQQQLKLHSKACVSEAILHKRSRFCGRGASGKGVGMWASAGGLEEYYLGSALWGISSQGRWVGVARVRHRWVLIAQAEDRLRRKVDGWGARGHWCLGRGDWWVETWRGERVHRRICPAIFPIRLQLASLSLLRTGRWGLCSILRIALRWADTWLAISSWRRGIAILSFGAFLAVFVFRLGRSSFLSLAPLGSTVLKPYLQAQLQERDTLKTCNNPPTPLLSLLLLLLALPLLQVLFTTATLNEVTLLGSSTQIRRILTCTLASVKLIFMANSSLMNTSG